MDSTGRWYVASDVWHPTLFRSGVQCTAHRTTHTHRRPRRRRRRPPSLRLDCRSRRASPVTTPLALAAPAGRCTPRHHSRSSRSLPLATVLWFPSVVDFPPPRHHPSTPPSPHTALARSPRRPPRRVAHSPPPPPTPPHRLAIASTATTLSNLCVGVQSHAHPNASVFTLDVAPITRKFSYRKTNITFVVTSLEKKRALYV